MRREKHSKLRNQDLAAALAAERTTLLLLRVWTSFAPPCKWGLHFRPRPRLNQTADIGKEFSIFLPTFFHKTKIFYTKFCENHRLNDKEETVLYQCIVQSFIFCQRDLEIQSSKKELQFSVDYMTTENYLLKLTTRKSSSSSFNGIACSVIQKQ